MNGKLHDMCVHHIYNELLLNHFLVKQTYLGKSFIDSHNNLILLRNN